MPSPNCGATFVTMAERKRTAEEIVANLKRARQERPTMGDDAYHGLAGEVVHTIEPHTEADPVAILLQFLTLAGNVMGRTAYYQVESDRHHTNLFAVLVGDSAKSRKGTSWGRARAIGKVSDTTWADDRVKGGLSSGEGLINEVRDERKEWNKKEGCEEVVDAGVKDKRLMVVEPEFASALAVAERHGNTLSALMRRAWDGDKLTNITKNTPLCATSAHISTVGHITTDELRARITRTDAANGFANRFMFALVKRSRLLPFGGNLDDCEIERLGEQLREAVTFAAPVGRVTMTADAKAEWEAVYPHLVGAAAGAAGRRDGARRGADRPPGADLRLARSVGAHRGAAPAGRAGLLGVLRVLRRVHLRQHVGRPGRRRDHAGAASSR